MPTEIEKVKAERLGVKEWISSIPFFLIHVAAIVLGYSVGLSWAGLGWLLLSYTIRGLFITNGYHRYLAHKSYKTSRWFQFLLALGGTVGMQKGPITWASNHRDHHRYSDTEKDPHSPVGFGFWWSHILWVIGTYETNYDNVRDLQKYPELRFLDRIWLIPPILFAALLYLVGGMTAFVWGGLIATVVSWQFTFMVNSVAHSWGSRPFNTSDNSRNVWWLGWLTWAEGFQNSHHFKQNSANIGMNKWELDLGFYVLRFLAWLGLIWDLRTYQPTSK